MIELQRIRENQETIITALGRRGIADAKERIEMIVALDATKRGYQTQLEKISTAIHKISKEMGIMMQTATTDLMVQKKEVHLLKEEAKHLMQQLGQTQEDLLDQLRQLPNLPHASVPLGKDAQDNEVVYQSEVDTDTTIKRLAHWDLIKQYDLVDFELGNKITGAGFPIYKGKGAKLQRALINFFLDQAIASGYIEVEPPILVNEQSAYGTGQLPDKEGQMYHIPKDGLYLIPTAEVSITNIYRDVIVSATDLPIKHVGYTPCFRREAGSWGAEVRGLNRLHQFDKVELVEICDPSDSYKNLERMVAYVQNLVEQLELPYRILKLCTGDLGFCSAMTYDIEVLSVGQQKWLEVSSISNFETFQSYRLGVRCKDKNKKSYLLHTLNGSGLALPRIVAALLEWNQSSDGIDIPKALQLYTGFTRIERP